MPWISTFKWNSICDRLDKLERVQQRIATTNGGPITVAQSVRALANHLGVEFVEAGSPQAVKKPEYIYFDVGGGGAGGSGGSTSGAAAPTKPAPRSKKRG